MSAMPFYGNTSLKHAPTIPSIVEKKNLSQSNPERIKAVVPTGVPHTIEVIKLNKNPKIFYVRGDDKIILQKELNHKAISIIEIIDDIFIVKADEEPILLHGIVEKMCWSE